MFDAVAVRQVFDGPDGLLQAARGKLFVEMSTVRPEVRERLAEEVVRAGGAFVGVSGRAWRPPVYQPPTPRA